MILTFAFPTLHQIAYCGPSHLAVEYFSSVSSDKGGSSDDRSDKASTPSFNPADFLLKILDRDQYGGKEHTNRDHEADDTNPENDFMEKDDDSNNDDNSTAEGKSELARIWRERGAHQLDVLVSHRTSNSANKGKSNDRSSDESRDATAASPPLYTSNSMMRADSGDLMYDESLGSFVSQMQTRYVLAFISFVCRIAIIAVTLITIDLI